MMLKLIIQLNILKHKIIKIIPYQISKTTKALDAALTLLK